MRVLSIQSHVVHGYVGNKSASFPLQLLGYDVDAINTVQLSNHTKYPSFTGHKLSGDQIMDLINGLDANGILSTYSHLLVGYIGRSSSLEIIREIIKKIKAIVPSLIVVIDTVLGDNDKLYVPVECVAIYRTLLKDAIMCTPNQYEAEWLSETKITDLDSALNAINKIHSFGVENVIITSTNLSSHPDFLPNVTEHKSMFLIASNKQGQFIIRFDELKGSFTGTGDLFAALLLGRINNDYDLENIKHACCLCLSSMNGVLKKTLEAESVLKGDGLLELAIVKSKKCIEDPKVIFQAVLIPKQNK